MLYIPFRYKWRLDIYIHICIYYIFNNNIDSVHSNSGTNCNIKYSVLHKQVFILYTQDGLYIYLS